MDNTGRASDSVSTLTALPRVDSDHATSHFVDHNRALIVEAMERYIAADMAPFATPGHKLGGSFDPELRALLGEKALKADMAMGGGLDDVHFRTDLWKRAEAMGAAAWGADRTFYLVNGSSAGNLAFLLATLKPGDKIICGRDMHKSMMVALIHTGAQPVYVAPRLHPELNVGLGLHPDDVAAAIAAHPDAKLVALVSPSYSGVSSDLESIATIAHAHGIPLYVDEAWGPHFHFHPDLPKSAMQSGADGAVTSTHKLLGAFTQSAILNVQGPRVDFGRIATTVGMSQTTSPAAFILASIDGARRQMALNGREMLDRTIALAEDAHRRLEAIPGIVVMDAESLGVYDYDQTKLLIDVNGIGMTGYEIELVLRNQYRILPEQSDSTGVTCLVTVGDTQASVDRLVSAFEEIASNVRGMRQPIAGRARRSSGIVIAPGVQAMSPREAFFSKMRAIPLSDALGETSAELVIPYPPGIPVLAPGDVISAEKLEYLIYAAEEGIYFSGAADHDLKTIRVVDRILR
jgi:arginine/lysine/ornithine decarboxylase